MAGNIDSGYMVERGDEWLARRRDGALYHLRVPLCRNERVFGQASVSEGAHRYRGSEDEQGEQGQRTNVTVHYSVPQSSQRAPPRTDRT